MSKNFEHIVHGRRRMSIVNESNTYHQEDSRLAQQIEKIEREKEK